MRGYVSYMRGNNPFEFPIRISCKENIPSKMLDLKKYPTLNINGTDKINNQIKYLDIVNCPFGKYQQIIFDQYLKTDQDTDKYGNILEKADFYPETGDIVKWDNEFYEWSSSICNFNRL